MNHRLNCLLYLLLLTTNVYAFNGPKPHVLVDRVQLQTNNKAESFIGQVIAIEQGDIAADVPGTVATVLVKVGDIVKQNQTLLELEPERYQYALSAAQAKVAGSNAEIARVTALVTQKDQELTREEGLKDSPAYSKARLDDLKQEVAQSKAELAIAKAKLQQETAELAQANLDLAKTKISAPFSGTIIEKLAQPGEYLQAGTIAIVLVNHNNLEIEIKIPSVLYNRIAPNSTFAITTATDDAFTAKLRAMLKFENTTSRTITLRAIPISPPSSLRPGQTVTANLNIGTNTKVITVHKDAIIQQGNQFSVFVVIGNKVQPVVITLGDAIADRFIVTNGLKGTELIVIQGNERLFPGQEVTYSSRDAKLN